MSTYLLAGNTITCRVCGLTSHNSNDVVQLYCGHCHKFHQPTSMSLPTRVPIRHCDSIEHATQELREAAAQNPMSEQAIAARVADVLTDPKRDDTARRTFEHQGVKFCVALSLMQFPTGRTGWLLSIYDGDNATEIDAVLGLDIAHAIIGRAAHELPDENLFALPMRRYVAINKPQPTT